jgi:uncharacterized delta-60 repeat protein
MSLIPLFRLFRRTPLAVSSLLGAFAASSVFGQVVPSAADGFNPNVTGAVNSIAVQTDGRIIIGGIFSALQPNGTPTATGANSLVRVKVDGTIDTIFPLGPVATIAPQVNLVALQPDGKILAAGAFTTSAVASGSVPAISNFARFTAAGALDTTFNIQLTGAFSAAVTALAVQPNGQIIIGGNFTTIQSYNPATGVLSAPVIRNHIARLNADGSVDGAFNPNANAQIDAIYVVPSQFPNAGQILIGGAFTTLNPNSITTTANPAIPLNHIARLNADGSADANLTAGVVTGFNPDANNQVAAIAMEADGRILIAGAFTTVQPNGALSFTPTPFLARLNSDGSVDAAYLASASAEISAIALQANGQLIIGGSFTAVAFGGLTNDTRSFIARLNADGTTDESYSPGANSSINALAIQLDGKVLVGGSFTQFHPGIAESATNRNGIARIDIDGTVDSDFDPDAYGGIGVITAAPNGQFLIGGSFATVGGVTSTNLARLNADGSVDPSFDPAPNGSVSAIAVQANGQIIVGGSFSTFGGITYYDSQGNAIQNVARLNANGSVDTTFNPDPSGPVTALAIQADGRIVMGGSFLTVLLASNATLPNGTAITTAPGYLVRLNTDGSLDTTFLPNPDGAINALLLEPSDNAVIIGGAFTNITPSANGTDSTSVYLARLNAKDGTVDTSFDQFPDSPVLSLALQPNGQVLVGGTFANVVPNGIETITTINGVSTTNLIPRNRIYRVNANGSFDATFNPNMDNSVYAVAATPSGQVWAAGLFKTVGGLSQPYLARLNATTGALDTTFNSVVNGDVRALLPLANGQIIAAGGFTTVISATNVSTTEYHVARFNADATASLDLTFVTAAKIGGSFSVFSIQSNGQILVGGAFTNVAGAYATNIARLFADNTYDSTFGGDADGAVNTITFNSDGSGTCYVGGAFANIGSGAAANFARLHNDGTLDTTFTSNTDGAVNAAVVQPDGKVVLGGLFGHVNGAAHLKIARVNFGDGSLDTTFNPSISGSVNSLALAPSASTGQTQILVGGNFTALSGTVVSDLARLNADGSVDVSFNPKVNGPVSTIAVQSDGRIVIGGTFTTVAGVSRSNLARLNPDGSVDASFNPSPNGTVNAVVLQVGTSVTGSFAVGGAASLDSIVIGGSFATVGGVSYPHAARINFDGTVDATFNPAPDAPVLGLAVQEDGKVFLGGTFAHVSGLPRNGIARLSASAIATQSITTGTSTGTSGGVTIVTGRSFTWTYGGQAPEVSSVLFQTSTDLVNWTNLGNGVRVAAATTTPSWTISNIPTTSLFSGNFFVRALAVENTGEFSSGSQVGFTAQVYQIQPPTLYSATALTPATNQPFYYEVAATNNGTTFTATGLPPGLSINASTGVISGTPTTAGSYTVFLTLANAGGSNTATLTINVGGATVVAATPRLVNLSSSSIVAIGEPLTDGFIITGPGSETVLLRGIGPALSAFQSSAAAAISSPLPTPALSLYNAAGQQILGTHGWDGSSALTQIMAQVGAFPLTAGSTDAAVVTTLAPGAYTLIISTADGQTGTALAEVYDADANPLTTPQRLGNLSANGTVNIGVPVTGGFVISGSAPKQVLLRGVGPALGDFGIVNSIQTPVLSIYNSAGVLVAQNTGWATQSAATVAAITAAAATAGAFPLPAGSADSAVLVTLAPGNYTGQVTDFAGNTGPALFEVYSLSP